MLKSVKTAVLLFTWGLNVYGIEIEISRLNYILTKCIRWNLFINVVGIFNQYIHIAMLVLI